MRLLDKPIRKTAELSNQQAILRLLTGTGIGAGAGALSELMLTGKLGWKGALAGGALGTGAAALLDPEARDKLVSTVRARASKKEPSAEPSAEPSEAPSEPPELSDLQAYRKIRQVMDSGVELPAPYQQFAKQYEEQVGPIRETIGVFNSPEYRKAAQRALSGSQYEGMTDTVKPLENEMIMYMNMAKQQTGKYPSPEHMFRFAIHGKQLPVNEWGSYLAGNHRLSGDEIQDLKTVVPQVALGRATGKLTPAIVQQLSKTPRGMAILERMAGKGSLPTFMSGTADQGIRTTLARLFRRKSTKAAGYGGAKLGGKLGLKGAGAIAKAAPGINMALDSFDLFYDPKSGTYSFNPKKLGTNARNVDELMEKRERHGTQLTGQKRNVLYNQGVGGLRGWLQPVTTATTAGRRIAGTQGQGLDAVKREGIGGAAQYMKGVAGVVPDYLAELYNLTEGTEGKQIKERDWGSTRAAPTAADIEAYRRSRK